MINTVVLTGRLTANPELKKTPSGKSVTSFTIANETGYGESQKTNFITIVAWQKTAEFVTTYFKKGNAIGITGRIDTRKYQDKNGNNRTSFEVIADEVHFIESKKLNEQQAEQPTQNNDFEPVDECDDLPF